MNTMQRSSDRPILRHRRSRSGSNLRRGFNLVELLIALTITATLLAATMAALDASFIAYQRTTEVANTHTIGRMAIHRMQALLRTGDEFGPFPTDPLNLTLYSDFIEFVTPTGDIMTLEYDVDDEALYVTVEDVSAGTTATYPLLEGVLPTFDGDGDRILPFTLEYIKGRQLRRASIDLTITPDNSMAVELDGVSQDQIRLVASVMPRSTAFN